MALSDQANDPSSTLNAFLDAHVPHRGLVAKQWIRQMRRTPWAPIDIEADRRRLGIALELRTGLDLADEPAHWGLLSFLPAGSCTDLLTAAGFTPAAYDHVPTDDTSDPLLLAWIRRSRPDRCEGPLQRGALVACVELAGVEQIAHRLHANPAAQVRRSLLLTLQAARGGGVDENHPVFQGLHHMWQAYLRYGRQELMKLGERTVIAPSLSPGFAIADLVKGRTLVEIKASAEPAKHCDAWLNQLLGYLLLDHLDIFCWEAVAIYLGWHATTLSVSVQSLLVASSAGTTPALSDLRAEFRKVIADELDEAASWHLRDRYPVPPVTSDDVRT